MLTSSDPRSEAARERRQAEQARKAASLKAQRRLLEEAPERRRAWEAAVNARLAAEGVVVSERATMGEVHQHGALKFRGASVGVAWHFARTMWAADVLL